MKKVKIIIDLFNYKELNEKSKKIAFNEHLNFLNTVQNEENYFYNIAAADVIESILINEYYFYKNGTLAHCVKYTGGKNKNKEFYIYNGKQYKI